MAVVIDMSALEGWPDPELLEGSAFQLAGSAQSLVNLVQECSSDWSVLEDAYRARESVVLAGLFGGVAGKAEGIRGGIMEASSALIRYAETLRGLLAKRSLLVADIAEFQSSPAVENPAQAYPGFGGTAAAWSSGTQAAQFQYRVHALAEEHLDAQRQCAAAFTAIPRTDGAVAEKYPGGALTDFSLQDAVAELHRLQAAPKDAERLLALLARLAPASLHSLGTANKAFFRSGLRNPPAAATVAAWWAGLSGAQRDAMVAAAPGVVGNLNGVPYSVRSKANRVNLDAVFADPRTTEESRETLGKIYGALDERKGASDGSAPSRSLVSFDPGDGAKPLAAISIGNLDTAGNVTWNVPGMGTTIEDGLESWTKSAQDLYKLQHQASTTHEKEMGFAVVSWIGYDTPEAPPSGEVLSTELAKAGGDRLAEALDGFRETRSEGGVKLHVVAHSYGSTTAAYALGMTRHQVDTATFFGSAGINEREISNAAALHVAPDHEGKTRVFVTSASGDRVAPLGIFGSGFSGREGRSDPRGSWFGATVFSSEGGYDPDTGKVYKRTSGHDANGWAQPDSTDSLFAATGEHGYLDPETGSAHNIALISTGHAVEIKELIPLKHETKVGYGGMDYPTGPLIERDLKSEELHK
jgi:pimeloyl-ACP methyl ester carboxylesterase